MALIASFVISMVTSKRTDYIKTEYICDYFSQMLLICYQMHGPVLQSCWLAALHWMCMAINLEWNLRKRLPSMEYQLVKSFPKFTDSFFAMCCSLTHHFFIHILIIKYLLQKTRSTVTSLNSNCSLRAGSREEARDKASSKRSSAHLNAGMRDDLAAWFPTAHSCPVSCKGMLNWPLQWRTILN